MGFSIGNRRYTGTKKSLLKDIYDSIAPYIKNRVVFADLFAGTGVVSAYMLDRGMDVIANDILQSNVVVYCALFGKQKIDFKKIEKLAEYFNSIDAKKLKENYFSKIYGSKYFSDLDARKIGYIRDRIEKEKLTNREKNILITALMYTADRIANTVGHFEHFLAKKPKDRGVVLRLPELKNFPGIATIFKMDANKLAREISCDIAYIDPPYNARQYVNFYHVLENLVQWDKPTEFEGNSMKFKRNHLKSDYSRAKAPQVFQDLIDHLQARVIVVSYNNTYSAKSSASNNKISKAQLIKILKSKGDVTVKEIKHKSFNSGKTDFKDHKEMLYICKVKS